MHQVVMEFCIKHVRRDMIDRSRRKRDQRPTSLQRVAGRKA
jgi:hypothetical protein